MNEKHLRRGGEACVQISGGGYSDAALHEQLTEGVDDSDFRMETRAKLLAQGVPISALDRVLPVRSKSEEAEGVQS
jgi:hypothetical protein